MSWLSERLARILYPPGVTRLDPKLATALFLILFAAQLTLTTPFSFLPAMVTSFGYKDRDRGAPPCVQMLARLFSCLAKLFFQFDRGFYAGMIASSLFIGRFFGGYFWGWLTDKLGRRPVLLISAFLTYVATIAFGFTTNIYWAITTRFLQGLFNGVIVVGRAAFAEICDETNQAIGVALVFAAWNSAIVLGPALGGFLATPVKKYPNVFRGENVQAFFTKYAFLLPSVLISLILILAILLIFFTFEETMPKRSPSPFEEIVIDEKKGLLTEEMDDIQKDDEGSLVESRCSEQDDEKKKCCDVTGWSIIELCRDKTLVLVVVMFGISGFSIIGFSELRSLWMATNIKYGGLSFSTDKIGIALLAPAIISVILQPILFGRLERKLGGITTLRMTLFFLALFTALFPLIHLSHSNRYLMWALLVIFGIVRMIADISSRSCIALFINNAVTAEKVGRANGFAFSVQEIMRVASPTMLGSLFAWSINERYHSITFPLDYHLSFFLIALFIGVILTLAYFLPKTINSPKDNNKTDTTIGC